MGRLYKIASTCCATVALLAFALGVLSLQNQARADDPPPAAAALFNCSGCAFGINEGNNCSACFLCGCALVNCPTCVCQGTGGGARGCY